jgi:hypothetical protein
MKIQTFLLHALSLLNLDQARACITGSLATNFMGDSILLVSNGCLVPKIMIPAPTNIIVVHAFKVSHLGFKVIKTLCFLFFLIQHVLVNSI